MNNAKRSINCVCLCAWVIELVQKSVRTKKEVINTKIETPDEKTVQPRKYECLCDNCARVFV